MSEEEPLAIDTPITIWGQTREGKPRRRCGVKTCLKPLHVATIDRGKIKVVEKKPGRPKKGEKRTRYNKIGYWCVHCGIFYYPNLSPNWKMRLEKNVKKKRRKVKK